MSYYYYCYNTNFSSHHKCVCVLDRSIMYIEILINIRNQTKKQQPKLHWNKLWLKCLKNRWFDKKTQAAKHVSTEDSVQHVPRYQNIHNPTPAVSNIVLSKCLKQIAGWQLWHHPKMLTVCFVPDAVNIDHSSNVM